MKRIESFLMLYAILLFSTVVVLSLLNVSRLDLYLAPFAIEFFVASELASPFCVAESRKKNIIGMLLLAVFAGIILQRVMEFLR